MTPLPPPVQRPPHLEFKSAALTTGIRPDPARPSDLIVETVVSLTGAEIGGGVEFAPGALGRAFRRRTVKGTRGPSWSHQTSIVESAVELPPGDPRLPQRLPSGSRWPAHAGGLWVRLRFIDNTDGRVGLAAARTAAPTQWSLGFKSLAEHRVAGRRVIGEVDVYTLWPDSLTTETSPRREVKDTQVRGLEFKVGHSAAAAAIGSAAADAGDVVRCSVCAAPAALVVGGLPPGRVLVCAECVNGVGLDDLAEPLPAAEDDYTDAQRHERPFHLGLDGELLPGEHPARRRF